MKVPFYFKKVNALKIHCFRNKKASCRNSSLKYIHKISSESAGTAKSPMTMHTATATAAIHHIDFCSVSSHLANDPFPKNPSSD